MTMIKDKLKRANFLNITNIIAEINNADNDKIYDTDMVDDLFSLLLKKDYLGAIVFMLDKEINIKDIIPTNYRQIQIIYSKTKDIELIKSFHEYNLLMKDIQEIDPNLIKKYLNSLYKNNSRKKGVLFKATCEYKYAQNPVLFSGFNVFFNTKDFYESNQDENYILFPSLDSHIIDILRDKGIELKKVKGRDVLIHYNGYYFVGEAKEIHENGGSQNNQFSDMVNCIAETNIDKRLIGFGVIYGASMLYENKYSIEYNKNKNLFLISEFICDINSVLNLIPSN